MVLNEDFFKDVVTDDDIENSEEISNESDSSNDFMTNYRNYIGLFILIRERDKDAEYIEKTAKMLPKRLYQCDGIDDVSSPMYLNHKFELVGNQVSDLPPFTRLTIVVGFNSSFRNLNQVISIFTAIHPIPSKVSHGYIYTSNTYLWDKPEFPGDCIGVPRHRVVPTKDSGCEDDVNIITEVAEKLLPEELIDYDTIHTNYWESYVDMIFEDYKNHNKGYRNFMVYKGQPFSIKNLNHRVFKMGLNVTAMDWTTCKAAFHGYLSGNNYNTFKQSIKDVLEGTHGETVTPCVFVSLRGKDKKYIRMKFVINESFIYHNDNVDKRCVMYISDYTYPEIGYDLGEKLFIMTLFGADEQEVIDAIQSKITIDPNVYKYMLEEFQKYKNGKKNNNERNTW